MKNPVWNQQEREQEILNICGEILEASRTELYLHLRFLDRALAALVQRPDNSLSPAGTDGGFLFYHPLELIKLFQKAPVCVTRLCLHILFHCLFAHIYPQEDRERELWNLSCDMAAEHLIDHLYIKCVHIPQTPLRREAYGWLEKEIQPVTAEKTYHFLMKKELPEQRLLELKKEFFRDDHRKWYEPPQKKPNMRRQKENWEDLRRKMQTEMETFSKEASKDAGELLETLRIHNQRKYDYQSFLRKFAVLKEEMKVDLDTFDYIFYHYGMELYGNMPLIEPLETREEKKIEDFVIAIDTSMSCKGELVERFLEETYCLLSQEESFSRKIRIHILQCDEQVRSDVRIENKEQLMQYMKHLTLKGGGGTDFRPVFVYVEELMAAKAFYHLRGLVYFTDGYGIYPAKMPPYQTAFVFMEKDYRDIDVPPWAVKLIIREEDIKGDSYYYDND